MRTVEECLEQAEALERLLEEETDEFRRNAYRSMAEYWRETAVRRAAVPQPE